jgi:hypothetical protein
MSETDLPNFKLKFVASLFGPTFKWLEIHNISGFFVALIGLGLLTYFTALRKRREDKITWGDKGIGILFFFILILTLIDQVWIIRGRKPDDSFLPERVRKKQRYYEELERGEKKYIKKESVDLTR